MALLVIIGYERGQAGGLKSIGKNITLALFLKA